MNPFFGAIELVQFLRDCLFFPHKQNNKFHRLLSITHVDAASCINDDFLREEN